jgi:hypothetical protein
MQAPLWQRLVYSAWTRPILLIALLIVLWQLGDLDLPHPAVSHPSTARGRQATDQRMAEAVA